LLVVILRFALATALLLPLTYAAAAQERCGVAKDFMVQALERIKTGSNKEVEDGVQLLKHANELCTSLGDAWYYRSLFERKLNQAAKADYSLGKAKLYKSEAMDQGIDPFSVATAGPAPTSNLPTGAVRRKWALIIGISQFTDPKVPRLNYPAKDALDFATVLKDPQVGRFRADDVRVLLNSEATTRQIKAGLNWLARSAQPDDLVVVFISSHGSPREMDTRNVNYIVTNDTEIRPQDQLFATALAMVEVTEVVRSRIQARRTLVLLDTCHSGAAAAGSSARMAEGVATSSVSADTLDTIRQGVGRAIITSSQVGEKSYENDDVKNGYFTYYLLQALRKSKGMDPIDKVYAYVRDQVSNGVAAKYKVTQTPVLRQSDKSADIIVGATPVGDASASVPGH
jgi:uncharacterized caspase-like protein